MLTFLTAAFFTQTFNTVFFFLFFFDVIVIFVFPAFTPFYNHLLADTVCNLFVCRFYKSPFYLLSYFGFTFTVVVIFNPFYPFATLYIFS